MATMGHAWKVLVWSAVIGVNDNMEDNMLLLWLVLGVLLYVDVEKISCRSLLKTENEIDIATRKHI